MSDYIQNLFADRIGGKNFGKETVLYKFEKIKRARRAAEAEHPETPIIDMGVGEPDWMADPSVVERLAVEAQKYENRGYADNGILPFQEAAAAYMQNVFGVSGLNPQTEICHSIGSKPALAMLPQVFINPGDVAIVTVPGYGVLATMTRFLGGEAYALPLLPENDFLPDLNAVPPEIAKRAKLLYINYPNNPTGAVATPEFFQEVIDFAKKNEIIVVSDAAYAALTFDGYAPLSFLSVPGAKDVGVEIQSLSKAFNMTGWRLGFVAGNEKVVKAFACIKDNNDSGQFKAIQYAGAQALSTPSITERTVAKYSRRHDLLVKTLTEVGFRVKKPKGSFYLYAQAPKGIEGGEKFNTAEDFSQWLIREKQISTVPWDDAGHFIRFSVTFIADSEEAEISLMKEIARRLAGVKFVW
ncbi:LL-diaminopimelate aminotransferase [Fibrobacter intestinalis]|uniref:Aminotransferase n=1 Tax=Fibrobacter intestinalis TaxID=28122 RepID=A0A1T4PR04_9BACT|nr:MULTISPECIES: LL-diaminopimelate aminotransferase [Fibrobacter]PBC72785.1 LL-diaminopimelate aminotransferase [Fibrobacter sp. NR9]SJZ93839.1 LL-diaminopimelate aminotransferase apoenzyme [Fibrobacter intestinalis]